MQAKRRWAYIGAIIGLAVGLADGMFFVALGLEVRFRSMDPTAVALVVYAVTIGLLGFAVGRWLEARSELIDSERLASIGRLAAGVAHEVRNPLAVIRSSAGLVLEGSHDEETTAAATFITEEVDRLESFVTALLDYARPMRADLQRTDLAELVQELQARSSVSFEQDVQTGAAASADPVLLSQLLLSLLINAGEAACEQIVVRARRDGLDVQIDVADDGPGIDAESRGDIFEPFFTTKAQGTGLGLPMASRTAKALGGRLVLVEGAGLGAGGAGACFRLLLRSAA